MKSSALLDVQDGGVDQGLVFRLGNCNAVTLIGNEMTWWQWHKTYKVCQCLSVYVPIFLSFRLSTFCLCVCFSHYISVQLLCLSVCLLFPSFNLIVLSNCLLYLSVYCFCLSVVSVCLLCLYIYYFCLSIIGSRCYVRLDVLRQFKTDLVRRLEGVVFEKFFCFYWI